MSRFFDTSEASPPEEPPKEKEAPIRTIVDREAVEAANKAMQDAGIETEFSINGVKQQDHGIVPVRYTKEIIGKWQVDHGARGDDYLFQLIPRKPIDADPRDMLLAIIQTLAQHISRNTEVFINPPIPKLEIDFYTIRLEGVIETPGAEKIVREVIPASLGAIDAWTT